MTARGPEPTRPQDPEETLGRIRECLRSADRRETARCLSEFHPSDVAGALDELKEDERLAILGLATPQRAAAMLTKMEADGHPERLLLAQPEPHAAAVLAAMGDDDAADLLGRLAVEDQERLVATLSPEKADTLRTLLRYESTTAGGLMTTNLVLLTREMTANEGISEVRRQGRRIDEEPYLLFVVDAHRRLLGTVSLRELVLASVETRLEDLATKPPAVVAPEQDQEEVARLFRRYDLPTLAVLRGDGTLLGRVAWDDVMNVLEEEQTEDLLRLSGAPPKEALRAGWGHAVRTRLPWLFVNLGSGALAASVVFYFQDTIGRLVILAAVMPVIAALGGNAGIQALAVTLRRITLEAGTARGHWRVAAKELVVGMINGAALGVVVGAVGYLWLGDLAFGLVVLVAMWGNLIIASFAGALVPVALERAGVDPAVASSVFVTTITDLAGFFLLLGLATAILL